MDVFTWNTEIDKVSGKTIHVTASEQGGVVNDP